jgi:hypothetical protein
MTVRELIKELADCDMNHKVYFEAGDRIAEVSSLTPPRTFSSSRMVVLATNDKVVLAISEQSQ